MASFPSSFGNAGTLPAANPSLGRVERLADVSPGLAEGIFLVVALLFFSNAQLVHSQATDASQSDPTTFAIQALLYGCFAPFLVRERAIVSRAAKCLIGVWALIALAFCSALWSRYPSDTLKHSVLLLVTTVFGIYFGARFSLPEQLRILALALGWAIALSAMTGALFPTYGVMTSDPVDTWCGIYPHRNALARMMVLAVLVFSLRRRLSGSRFRNTVGILAAIGLIMLTKSMTGALILALMFLVLNVGRILFWKRATKVTAVVAVAAALTSLGAWLITNWVSAMEALGRSSTLTGRIPLWIICTLLGLRKPWLGYGFTGFWRGYDGPSAGVWKIVGWKPPNAHNGFLDIWLSLGLVGLAFFLAFFARLVWRTIAAVHFGSPPEALWPLSYVLFVFLYNIDETDLLQQNSLIWVLLVGACVSLSRSKWAAESLAEKTD